SPGGNCNTVTTLGGTTAHSGTVSVDIFLPINAQPSIATIEVTVSATATPGSAAGGSVEATCPSGRTIPGLTGNVTARVPSFAPPKKTLELPLTPGKTNHLITVTPTLSAPRGGQGTATIKITVQVISIKPI